VITGIPSEILIQSNQRYHYDRAWEFAGALFLRAFSSF
jgi:hypothetical protein